MIRVNIKTVEDSGKSVPKGVIRVVAKKSNTKRVSVTVEDTGIGIDERDMPKLFAPFGRLHNPGDDTYPGTGLGLYLTKKIVTEVLQGEIKVRSVLGVGTSFTMDLPTKVKK